VCRDDTACPPGLRCDTATGRCACRRDADCGVDRFCNQAGFCQSLLGCQVSADCPGGFFCDVTGSICRAAGACTADFHCATGEICDRAIAPGRCVAGCRTSADCLRYQVCLGGRCTGRAEPGDRCESDAFCRFREFCRDGRCALAEGEFCAPCESGDDCAGGACLFSINEGQRDQGFCGVECTEDPECPSGMECDRVYWRCDPRGGRCPNGLPCERVETVNNEPTFYCVDPDDGLPAVIQHYCGPRGSVCE
jgi:hypothetical protein